MSGLMLWNTASPMQIQPDRLMPFRLREEQSGRRKSLREIGVAGGNVGIAGGVIGITVRSTDGAGLTRIRIVTVNIQIGKTFNHTS